MGENVINGISLGVSTGLWYKGTRILVGHLVCWLFLEMFDILPTRTCTVPLTRGSFNESVNT